MYVYIYIYIYIYIYVCVCVCVCVCMYMLWLEQMSNATRPRLKQVSEFYTQHVRTCVQSMTTEGDHFFFSAQKNACLTPEIGGDDARVG
jgi:hypothetical protein